MVRSAGKPAGSPKPQVGGSSPPGRVGSSNKSADGWYELVSPHAMIGGGVAFPMVRGGRVVDI